MNRLETMLVKKELKAAAKGRVKSAVIYGLAYTLNLGYTEDEVIDIVNYIAEILQKGYEIKFV